MLWFTTNNDITYKKSSFFDECQSNKIVSSHAHSRFSASIFASSDAAISSSLQLREWDEFLAGRRRRPAYAGKEMS